MSPKETKQLNATLDKRIKEILEQEAAARNMSQTEYLERLIEGTLPDRLSEEMQALRHEIESLRQEIKK